MTRRERYILECMRDSEGFIWLVDGRRWPYPALCYGRTIERITRVMLERLEARRWIAERVPYKASFGSGSWFITDTGRKALD